MIIVYSISGTFLSIKYPPAPFSFQTSLRHLRDFWILERFHQAKVSSKAPAKWEKMYWVVIILCLVGTMCTGAFVPQSEDVGKQQHSITQKPMTMNGPNYSGGQDNHRISSSLHYYPTYPEYTNNGYGAANNKGYAIQSGYEGYLMPTMLSEQKNTQWSAGNVAFSLLPLSSRLILYGARAGSFLLHFTLLMLMGGVFTTLICTFTPICDITFPGLGINKTQASQNIFATVRLPDERMITRTI